ncbi:MAG: sugar phosphate nucleotidyltransferase [Solirubrobacteraceae bacterium]
MVALGDTIISPGRSPSIVTRLIEAFEQNGASAALAVEPVPAAAVSRYGIVVTEDAEPGDRPLEVTDVIEKPGPGTVTSRLAVAARYVLGPEVFAALQTTTPDPSGGVQLADALRAVIGAGGRVLAVPLAAGERRHDIGTVEGYCATFIEHALGYPLLGPGLRAHALELLGDER